MRRPHIKALATATITVAAVLAGTSAPAAATPALLERLAPGSAVYAANAATFSPPGDVTATAAFVDVQIPPGPTPNSSTSGCEAADFAGFPAGAIAVIQRGTCTFADKAANAAAAGAVAAVIFNEGQPGRTDVFGLSLGGPGVAIPVIGTSFGTGAELHSLQPGLSLRVAVSVANVGLCLSPPAPGTAVGGKNVVMAEPGTPTSGTPGPDVIYGTAGPDRIDGLGGDDIVFGFGGNDLLVGGDGNDVVCGGDGNDFVDGGGGDDVLSGDEGNDHVAGGDGADELFDTSGRNLLNGGPGNDFCSAGATGSVLQSCEATGS